MSLPQSGDERKTNLQTDQNRDGGIDQCALLTGAGRSAIAVIGLRGPTAAITLQRCFAAASASELLAGQIRYGHWKGRAQFEAAGESVVVTPTKSEVAGVVQFEIHCHGGPAAVERIIDDLQGCGAIRVETTVWFGLENLLIAEAQSVLAQCVTQRTAAIAMDQVRGVLADWTHGWIRAMQAGFENDDSSGLARLRQEAQIILDRASIGFRLADPFRVVLVGPPNVGKSSLVNALVGFDRSVTFDQAGTTRDVLNVDTVIDGIPIRLSDTAGIRESDEAIEQEGVARARAAASQADLLLQVSAPDGSLPLDAPSLGRFAPGRFERGSGPGGASEPVTLQVFNKIDLLKSGQTTPPQAIATNALTGEGIPELLRAIADQLGRSLPQPGQPVPVNRRQSECLSELVRTRDQPESLKILRTLLGERE